MPSHRPLVVFSGGTAANHLVDVFESIRKSKDCPISYIIPISDNGGSSSELIRVFGGPGIGDVRSRLVRLIPRLPPGSPGFHEREAIRALFNHRLSSTDARAAKMEWADVVDGTSGLWDDVSSAKKELIRSFFNVVNAEITKRSRPPNSTFDFTSASVGNLFLTGARLFSGSFESAIYLLGSICGIGDEHIKVIPSINSNFSHHIAAGLEDGSVIVGQNAISHPSPDAMAAVPGTGAGMVRLVSGGSTLTSGEPSRPVSAMGRGDYDDEHVSTREHRYKQEHEHEHEEEEDANLPGTLPTLRTKNIAFNKDAHLNEDLPARISRIWYINPYGQEILPPANPRALQAINNAQAVIYSIGSLYTSLAPSLVLRGVGEALRRNSSAGGATLRTKILILNGCLDREVGPQPPHKGAGASIFSAVDFVEGIVRAGEQSRGVTWEGGPPRLDRHRVDQPSTTSPATGSGLNNTSSISGRLRPPLLSSKSESMVRTVAKPSHHRQWPVTSSTQTHLFPRPLLASTTPSAAPSREASPSSSRSPSPTPPPPPPLPTTDTNTNSETATATANPTLRSNSTVEALKFLSPTTTTTTTTTTTSNNTNTINTINTITTASKPNPIYTSYITHLIHLPNSATTPYVDRDQLISQYGIHCIKVYGRTAPDGQGMRYDPSALRGAIEAVLGRRAERVVVHDDGVQQGSHHGGNGERMGKAKTKTETETEQGHWARSGEKSWDAWKLGRRNTLDGAGVSSPLS